MIMMAYTRNRVAPQEYIRLAIATLVQAVPVAHIIPINIITFHHFSLYTLRCRLTPHSSSLLLLSAQRLSMIPSIRRNGAVMGTRARGIRRVLSRIA